VKLPCKVCGLELDEEQFFRNVSNHSRAGRDYECKRCYVHVRDQRSALTLSYEYELPPEAKSWLRRPPTCETCNE
jgi:hypothetical protein